MTFALEKENKKIHNLSSYKKKAKIDDDTE